MLPDEARATPHGLVKVASCVIRPVEGATRTSRRKPNSTTSREPFRATSMPSGWSSASGADADAEVAATRSTAQTARASVRVMHVFYVVDGSAYAKDRDTSDRLANQPACRDPDHVIDDAASNRERAVVQVDAAAGVVRDDLQVLSDARVLVDR